MPTMARGALNRGVALGLACALACALPADYRQEEQAARLKRAVEDVRQLVFGQRVVIEAHRWVGRPYVWGGKTPQQGFDCSGYTAYVFGRMGVALARTALGQFQQGFEVEQSALEPGDLVFFTGQGSPLHVGIFEGGGRFLHAPRTGKVIESSRLDSPYFARRFVGARRIDPSPADERRLQAVGTKARPQSTPQSSPSPAS